LQDADTVRVTSPAGTDFTFSVGDRPIIVDDGIVTAEDRKSNIYMNRVASLPGGRVFLAPVETEVSGTVGVPKDRCNYEPLTGVSFRFEDGRMQDFEAEEGEACFEQTMAPYVGPKDRFGYFSIGLNPALKIMEDEADYRPWNAAGMVVIGVGWNKLFGGENTERGGFTFPITNATVEVDGTVVGRDGKLVL
jgi:aminopeptidase